MSPWDDGVRENPRAEPGINHDDACGQVPAASHAGLELDQRCDRDSASSAQDDSAA